MVVFCNSTPSWPNDLMGKASAPGARDPQFDSNCIALLARQYDIAPLHLAFHNAPNNDGIEVLSVNASPVAMFPILLRCVLLSWVLIRRAGDHYGSILW